MPHILRMIANRGQGGRKIPSILLMLTKIGGRIKCFAPRVVQKRTARPGGQKKTPEPGGQKTLEKAMPGNKTGGRDFT